MNAGARVISNTHKYDSGLSFLLNEELHWLDVVDRVRYKLAVLAYRSLHGTAPQYLTSLARRHLRSLVVSTCDPLLNRN